MTEHQFINQDFYKVTLKSNGGTIRIGGKLLSNQCFLISIMDYIEEYNKKNKEDKKTFNILDVKKSAQSQSYKVNKDDQEINFVEHDNFINFIKTQYNINIINIYGIYNYNKDKYINYKNTLYKFIDQTIDEHFFNLDHSEHLYNSETSMYNVINIGYYPGHFEYISNIKLNEKLKITDTILTNFTQQFNTIKQHFDLLKNSTDTVDSVNDTSKYDNMDLLELKKQILIIDEEMALLHQIINSNGIDSNELIYQNNLLKQKQSIRKYIRKKINYIEKKETNKDVQKIPHENDIKKIPHKNDIKKIPHEEDIDGKTMLELIVMINDLSTILEKFYSKYFKLKNFINLINVINNEKKIIENKHKKMLKIQSESNESIISIYKSYINRYHENYKEYLHANLQELEKNMNTVKNNIINTKKYRQKCLDLLNTRLLTIKDLI
jgi:hypothetical protein